MIIADQLVLFFKKVREKATNSALTAEEGLEYINGSRRSEAAETKFYDVKDSITADGGETYFTLLDTFLDLQDARDCVTRNGYPVVIESLAEWATLTNNGFLPMVAGMTEAGGIGMLHGNTFYVYPAAVAGDVFVWWGAAEPPALPDVTGPDVYLNNIQAELTILGAAIEALEDLGERPGEVLISKYKRLKKIVKDKAKPRGPRLENAPRE